MTSSGRTYAGSTQQQRKAVRRAALVNATLDLLADGGIERVTVSGVCAKARLNDRYFYESFRDRDELVQAAFEAMLADAAPRTLAVLAEIPGLDTAATTKTAIRAAIDFFLDNPRYGPLVLESQATPALRARRAEFTAVLVDLVMNQARILLGDKPPSEIDLRLAALTLVSGALETLTAWLRREIDVTPEHLVEFLTAMFLATADISTAIGPSDRNLQ